MALPQDKVAAAKAGILIFYAFGILFGLVLYKLVLFPFFLSPLRGIPAPHWSCRISGAWAQKRSRDWGVEDALFWEAMHRRLGAVLVVGPNEVRVGGVHALEVLDEVRCEKGEWYKTYKNYGVSNILADVDPYKNAVHRERMRRIYSTRFLLSASPFPAQVQSILGVRLASYLCSAALSSQPMDALRLSLALSIDILTAYIYGVRHGTHDLAYDKMELSMFGKCGLKMAKMGDVAALLEGWNMRVGEAVRAAYQRQRPARNVDVPTVFLATCADAGGGGTAEESMNETWERDFTAWCAGDKEWNPPALQDVNDSLKSAIASETYAHITAGHEPIAVTLAYAILHISSTPAMQQRLHDEVRRTGFSHAAAGAGATLPPRLEALDACPLLRAALKETLRLHPGLPGLQTRVAPADGMRIAGCSVPRGVAVAVAAAEMHHARDAFARSDVWVPDRWMQDGEDGEEHFAPFGCGPRGCVGDEFAFIVLSYSLAVILGSFSLTLIDDSSFIPRYWRHAMGFDSKAALLVKVEQRVV